MYQRVFVLEKGLQRFEDDIAEKDGGKRNAVIRNGPQLNEGSNGRQKQHGITRVNQILDIQDPNVIVNVVRLGSRKDKDGVVKNYPRALLVTLKNPEMAQFYHDYEIGYKTFDGYWVNPGPSKLQREAIFRVRQQRRESKKRQKCASFESVWRLTEAFRIDHGQSITKL